MCRVDLECVGKMDRKRRVGQACVMCVCVVKWYLSCVVQTGTGGKVR